MCVCGSEKSRLVCVNDSDVFAVTKEGVLCIHAAAALWLLFSSTSSRIRGMRFRSAGGVPGGMCGDCSCGSTSGDVLQVCVSAIALWRYR